MASRKHFETKMLANKTLINRENKLNPFCFKKTLTATRSPLHLANHTSPYLSGDHYIMKRKQWKSKKRILSKYFEHFTFPSQRSEPCGSAWRLSSAPRAANRNQTRSSENGSHIVFFMWNYLHFLMCDFMFSVVI